MKSIEDAATAATIKFRTKVTGFKKDERPCYSAYVLHNGTVRSQTLKERVARRCGYDESIVGCVWSGTFAQMRDEFRNGNRIDLDEVAGGLNVQGLFTGLNDPWDPARHALVPSLAAKGSLRACLDGTTAENATDAPTIVVRRVMDVVAKVDGSITGTAPVSVYVSGSNLLVDPSAEDEGAWLEDASGTIVARATTTTSTQLTLDCTFAELPPDGTYWFAVAGRGGIPEGGVSIGRRKVTVQATATEGE